MTLVTYLHRHPKTGVYWFRRAVPAPLRAALGRREITESLGTKAPAEAKRRLPAAAARAEAELEAARSATRPARIGAPSDRARAPQAPAAAAPMILTASDAERIAARYMAEETEAGLLRRHTEASRRPLAEVEEAVRFCEEAAARWRTALRECDWSGVRDLALRLLERDGVPEPDGAGMALLCHALVRALVHLMELDAARYRGEWPALLPPAPAPAAAA